MLQRVKSASVTVDGQLISSIGKGVLVLAAVSARDTEKEVESMAAKVLKTKLWDDESTDPVGRWKHNVKEIDGEVLCGAYHLKSIACKTDVIQCLNSHYLLLQRKATSQTSTSLQVVRRRGLCTTTSISKSKVFMARPRSRTASSLL